MGKKKELTEKELKSYIKDLDKPIRSIINRMVEEMEIKYSDIFNIQRDARSVRHRNILWYAFMDAGINQQYVAELLQWISIGFDRCSYYSTQKKVKEQTLDLPDYILPIWEKRLNDLKPLPTRNDGLKEQLKDLVVVAEKFRFTKAAEYLRRKV